MTKQAGALRLGVIGGGQLARMMIPAAVNLGIELRVLAETVDAPAALAATMVGDYRDAETVLAFASEVDAITFDHEHVPQSVLRALVEAGVAVHPGPDALRFAQDKIEMRTRLSELGVPVPEWAAVRTPAELDAFIASHGGKAVVKQSRGGYDGKGVRVVANAHSVADWFAALEAEGALLVEELVAFRRELAQLVARRPSGELRAWPVVETEQREGVCAVVIAPAPDTTERLREVAAQIAVQVAEGVGVTGVLAVELFETSDGRLLVNELAMRPHNSGHWSMDGAITGQFEHVRAVLDLPLGDPSPREAWSVMVNILGGPQDATLTDRYVHTLADEPGIKVHNYGKAPRPGRKVGHVNAFGAELDEVMISARRAAQTLDSLAIE